MMAPSGSPARKLVKRLDASPRTAVLACAVLGLVAPVAYGLIIGVRVPKVHDEFSYLLAADTFARGRLTNPAPRHSEFFETEHILFEPTYMSKFPPGQGVALAAGKALLGEPVWGVWLSSACFAASLCWMLQAWTSARWAWLVTVFAILGGGTSAYWAQSYWGGMVAACGGALLLGGLRRTLHRASCGTSLLMGVGVILMAATRPYEGLLLCVPVALVLVRWLSSRRQGSFASKLRSWLLPFGTIVGAGAGALLVYNHAVTGSWRELPHDVYHRQYFHTGLFLFSSAREPQHVTHPRHAAFYAALNNAQKSGLPLLSGIAVNFSSRLIAIFEGTLFEQWVRPKDFLWRGFLALTALTAVCRKDAWFWFSITTLLFVVAGQSIVRWWMMHYSAPLAPLVLVLVANCCRRLCAMFRHARLTAVVVPGLLLLGACGQLLANHRGGPSRPAVPTRKGPANVVIDGPVSEGPCPFGPHYEVIRRLRKHPGRHLVFVRYGEDASLLDECVENEAGIAAATIVFARDFGREKNRELVSGLPGRSLWLATVTEGRVRLEPCADAVASADPKDGT